MHTLNSKVQLINKSKAVAVQSTARVLYISIGGAVGSSSSVYIALLCFISYHFELWHTRYWSCVWVWLWHNAIQTAEAHRYSHRAQEQISVHVLPYVQRFRRGDFFGSKHSAHTHDYQYILRRRASTNTHAHISHHITMNVCTYTKHEQGTHKMLRDANDMTSNESVIYVPGPKSVCYLCNGSCLFHFTYDSLLLSLTLLYYVLMCGSCDLNSIHFCTLCVFICVSECMCVWAWVSANALYTCVRSYKFIYSM